MHNARVLSALATVCPYPTHLELLQLTPPASSMLLRLGSRYTRIDQLRRLCTLRPHGNLISIHGRNGEM
jgi:hypothetical protein